MYLINYLNEINVPKTKHMYNVTLLKVNILFLCRGSDCVLYVLKHLWLFDQFISLLNIKYLAIQGTTMCGLFDKETTVKNILIKSRTFNSV